jgi:UDP-glucose 6-dehydrogenase
LPTIGRWYHRASHVYDGRRYPKKIVQLTETAKRKKIESNIRSSIILRLNPDVLSIISLKTITGKAVRLTEAVLFKDKTEKNRTPADTEILRKKRGPA